MRAAMLGLVLLAFGAAPALAAEGPVQASAPKTVDAHSTVRVQWRASVARGSGAHRGIVVLNERRTRGGPILRRHVRYERDRHKLRGVQRYTFALGRAAAHAAASGTTVLDATATQQRDPNGDGTYDDTRVSSANQSCETLAPNVDISGCDLNSLFAPNVDLLNATAIKTVFDGAVMTKGTLSIMTAPLATFRGAHLAGANFAGAVLAAGDATEADFTGADLESTTLTDAVLLNATITGTNFHGAVCGNTTWVDGSIVGTCPGA